MTDSVASSDAIAVSLGDLAQLQVGFAFKSAEFSDATGAPRLLRGDNIGQGSIRWDRTVRWEGAVDPRYHLSAGDVVLAMDRPWIEAGLKFSSVHQEDLPAYLVQRVARLRAKEQVDQRYLHYLIASKEFTQHVLSVQTGTGIPHISGGQILEFSTTHRPLHEQRAIAEVLGALDDKIAANNRLVMIADQLAGALLKQAMDGAVEVLADCAALTMGSSPPGSSYNEREEGMPFFQGVRDFGVRFPGRRVWTTSPVRTAEPGDVLLSVRAPVGRANVARERLCIGRGLASIRSTSGTPFTLFHRIRAADSEWAPYESEGTIFGSINKTALENVKVPTVRARERIRLESDLAALEGRIAAALSEDDLLAKTRDVLLPLLMSGKLRVKDAEKKVEAIV